MNKAQKVKAASTSVLSGGDISRVTFTGGYPGSLEITFKDGSSLNVSPNIVVDPGSILAVLAFEASQYTKKDETEVIPKSPKYTKKDIEVTVKRAVSEKMGLFPEKITNSSSFIHDLDADSLDQVELIMYLEDIYDIEISDEDANKILTVQDAIDYVCKRVL
jgi:acyl carrier protein